MEIKNLSTDEEIKAIFPVMSQLRRHLDKGEYLAAVRRMQTLAGYRLAAGFEEERVRCVAGYRFMELLAYGKILYVDDLVTDETSRSRDFGGGSSAGSPGKHGETTAKGYTWTPGYSGTTRIASTSGKA